MYNVEMLDKLINRLIESNDKKLESGSIKYRDLEVLAVLITARDTQIDESELIKKAADYTFKKMCEPLPKECRYEHIDYSKLFQE